MEKATLCLLLRGDDEVLMARKTRGDGEGKMNFPGGKLKLEDCDNLKFCVARECRGEVGVSPDLDDLELVGRVRFYFAGVFKWGVAVFTSRRWQEVPRDEGEDMADPVWIKVSSIPYGEMWPGDIKWIPQIINGEKINADIYYSADGTIVEDVVWHTINF